MIISIPKIWESINLLTETDPNKFGEALRHYCFVGNCMETGCYSTFLVVKWLKEIKSGKIYQEAKKIIQPEFIGSLHVFHFQRTKKDCWIEYNDFDGKIVKSRFGDPEEIVCAWEWNGDGTLYFRFNNKKVINTDCKKDYEWEWIK